MIAAGSSKMQGWSPVLLLLFWLSYCQCRDPFELPVPVEKCGVARVQCGHRIGCGAALNEYMARCAGIITGKTKTCNMHCIRSLIALTSTVEGKSLMSCDCEGNEYCELSKQRVEVCREEVNRVLPEGSVVSCSVAHWICEADHPCSTALDYYHRLCRAMFDGRKCTKRCNNSIAILDRQDKASKLRSCYCDGNEEFPCKKIRRNTNWLCFGRENGGQMGGELLPETSTQDTTGQSGHDSVDDKKSESEQLRITVWMLVIAVIRTCLLDKFR